MAISAGTLRVLVLRTIQNGSQSLIVSTLAFSEFADATLSTVSDKEMGRGTGRKQSGLHGAKAKAAEAALERLKRGDDWMG